MAALQENAHARRVAPTPQRDSSSPKRPLPNGPCNYRDQNLGACGCTQFWDKFSADLYDGSTDQRPDNARSTWCVCSHHACFHLYDARDTAAERLHTATVQAHVPQDVSCDGRSLLQSNSKCRVHTGTRSGRLGDGGRAIQESPSPYNRRLIASSFPSGQQQAGCGASPLSAPALNLASTEPLSQSGLPRIPAVCLLSGERRLREEQDAARQRRSGIAPQDQHVAGLGFSFERTHPPAPSVSSTVVSEINKVPQPSFGEPLLSPIRADSTRPPSNHVTSPAPGAPLTQVLEFNRTLQINVPGDTIPNTYNPDDFVQSATEVATPSNANTPDLGQIDHAVAETKKLVDTLARLTSYPDSRNSQESRPASVTAAPGVPSPLRESSIALHDQLQQAVKSGSPQVLQKLVSYLDPLHNLLIAMPNLAGFVRDLNHRIDHLENNSFNHVQPEDIQQQLELYESRLIEVEHRMDDHDALHKTIDAEHSSSSVNRQVVRDINESFGSQHSATALTHISMAREQLETEFESIKDRLDILEAAAMPSIANPWEVEVILLPWGPELRGIWYSPEEPMHDPAKPITQESEEWTQGLHLARSSSVGARSTGSSFGQSDAESGWSSQAIGNWVTGDVDEWLFPKACGSNNLVYKRLQSRGFVKDVTFHSAGARDIQSTLSKAFRGLSDQLKFTEGDNSPSVDAYPGLRASFIPLRKTLKESRLRFLTPAEMASSALWSAQFLSSGVMMRVSGGKKRLYVTQREAYLQENTRDEQLVAGELPRQGGSWTWREIRQLPRFQPDAPADSRMEGNDDQGQPKVPEADAKEACWAFVETYDAPPTASANSSFNSNHSAPVELSMRPAGRQWRRSITPSSILKNRQPLSPSSEGHPLRPGHRRARTFSASVVEQAQQVTGKRRFASPVKPPSSSNSSRNPQAVSNPKRRRVRAPSSCPRVDVEAATEKEAQVVLGMPNSRRARDEPPTPFSSSNPTGLARTNSDAASRSERSAMIGPFAYATPYSEPLHSGGAFGDFTAGGDTEPDSDYMDDDDGEQSWGGVDDEDEGGQGDDEGHASSEANHYDSSASSSDDGNLPGSNEHGSFSGEDSVFGSDFEKNENEGEDGDSDYAYRYRSRRSPTHDTDGDEVFDKLLGALEED